MACPRIRIAKHCRDTLSSLPFPFRVPAFVSICSMPTQRWHLALELSGRMAACHGWRAAFGVVGIPGMVLALAVALWVPEPRRPKPVVTSGGVAAPPVSVHP